MTQLTEHVLILILPIIIGVVAIIGGVSPTNTLLFLIFWRLSDICVIMEKANDRKKHDPS